MFTRKPDRTKDLENIATPSTTQKFIRTVVEVVQDASKHPYEHFSVKKPDSNLARTAESSTSGTSGAQQQSPATQPESSSRGANIRKTFTNLFITKPTEELDQTAAPLQMLVKTLEQQGLNEKVIEHWLTELVKQKDKYLPSKIIKALYNSKSYRVVGNHVVGVSPVQYQQKPGLIVLAAQHQNLMPLFLSAIGLEETATSLPPDGKLDNKSFLYLTQALREMTFLVDNGLGSTNTDLTFPAKVIRAFAVDDLATLLKKDAVINNPLVIFNYYKQNASTHGRALATLLSHYIVHKEVQPNHKPSVYDHCEKNLHGLAKSVFNAIVAFISDNLNNNEEIYSDGTQELFACVLGTIGISDDAEIAKRIADQFTVREERIKPTSRSYERKPEKLTNKFYIETIMPLVSHYLLENETDSSPWQEYITLRTSNKISFKTEELRQKLEQKEKAERRFEKVTKIIDTFSSGYPLTDQLMQVDAVFHQGFSSASSAVSTLSTIAYNNLNSKPTEKGEPGEIPLGDIRSRNDFSDDYDQDRDEGTPLKKMGEPSKYSSGR
jgi:hypothetical protein